MKAREFLIPVCCAWFFAVSGCESGHSSHGSFREKRAALSAPVPMPLTKWSEVKIEANKRQSTKANRVFIADGSVGLQQKPRKWANYYALVGPTDAASADPKKNEAIFVLKNPEPSLEIEQGVGYAAGVWPRIVVRWGRGWTSSTHLGGQVVTGSASDHSKDVSRIFLLYPEYGQAVSIQITDVNGNLTGETVAIVAAEGSNPATDDWYVEMWSDGTAVKFTKPMQVKDPAVPQEVRDIAAKIKQSAHDAGIPHP